MNDELAAIVVDVIVVHAQEQLTARRHGDGRRQIADAKRRRIPDLADQRAREIVRQWRARGAASARGPCRPRDVTRRRPTTALLRTFGTSADRRDGQ